MEVIVVYTSTFWGVGKRKQIQFKAIGPQLYIWDVNGGCLMPYILELLLYSGLSPEYIVFFTVTAKQVTESIYP